MRDFLNIMIQHGYFRQSEWSISDSMYTFSNGSVIEFFGADQADKLRGGRRKRLFINEANNITLNAFNELEVRTQEDVWIDYNPTNEFWAFTDVMPQREKDVDFITLTYKDNEALDPQIIQSIEARRDNKAWWTVYGLGQLGETEARIYTNWQIVDDIPHEARLERRGLDFGYSNDPTAIIDLYYYNGGYIVDEQTFQKGLSNKDIAGIISNLPEANKLIVADSAEPKSIDELKAYGVNVMGCQKGPGSRNQGIQHVQSQRMSMTKRSVNIIKEYRNYIWTTDKDGKILNDPMEGFDHGLDAVRYSLEGIGNNYQIATKPRRYVMTAGDPVTGFGRRRVAAHQHIEDMMP
jgi:phage terminase large subunit